MKPSIRYLHPDLQRIVLQIDSLGFSLRLFCILSSWGFICQIIHVSCVNPLDIAGETSICSKLMTF